MGLSFQLSNNDLPICFLTKAGTTHIVHFIEYPLQLIAQFRVTHLR